VTSAIGRGDGRESGTPGVQHAPPGAGAIFGEVMPLAEAYAALLAGRGVERGLVGPSEAERVWDRHLLNCAAVVELVPPECTLADIGSGAGLPGLVIAMLRPHVAVTLVEPMARRSAFLEECRIALKLANVEVRRGRAEDLAGLLAVDVVTARAVAPLERLAGLCLGLLRPGGLALAMKGVSAEQELARAQPMLRRLGVRDARVVDVGGAGNAAAARVVMFSAPRRRQRGRRGSQWSGSRSGR
jgi:16S rRNA (guanine527-N7)-methyltransferase